MQAEPARSPRSVPLRRLTALTQLSAQQLALVGLDLLRDLAEMHARGGVVGPLEPATLLVGPDGRLAVPARPIAGRGRHAGPALLSRDLQAASGLLAGLLATRRPPPTGPDALRGLRDAVGGGGWPAGDAAGAAELWAAAGGELLSEPAQRQARRELSALVDAIGDSGALAAAAAAPERPVAEAAGAGRPARRRQPSRRASIAAGVAILCFLVLMAIAIVAPSAPAAAHARTSTAAKAAARPASAARPARAPSPPADRPAPLPAPVFAAGSAATAGLVSLRSLGAACLPGHQCLVQTTVHLKPRPQPATVAWSFRFFDPCTGETIPAPGLSVTAAAGWDYVYGDSQLDVPGRASLLLIAVSGGAVVGQSTPLNIGPPRTSC